MKPFHLFIHVRLLCLAWLAVSPATFAADDYKLGPDSQSQDGVPRGTVTKYSWTNSTVYPGTVRDYWVYVPRQYDVKPACLMVFRTDGYMNTAPMVSGGADGLRQSDPQKKCR
jgi:hypothetical protein